MVFTVGLPGVTRNFEYEAYLRLLERNGVNVANTHRVADPVTRKKWLHAWSNEAAAQKFAAKLRKQSNHDNWKVYTLPHGEPPGPLGPIEILIHQRSDGCCYGLSPTSKNLIWKSFPKANMARTVFIGTTTPFDFATEHGPLLGHIATILTGLSEQQIEHLGNYQVIDSLTKQVLHDVPPLVS